MGYLFKHGREDYLSNSKPPIGLILKPFSENGAFIDDWEYMGGKRPCIRIQQYDSENNKWEITGSGFDGLICYLPDHCHPFTWVKGCFKIIGHHKHSVEAILIE